jgi:hypothetical protein
MVSVIASCALRWLPFVAALAGCGRQALAPDAPPPPFDVGPRPDAGLPCTPPCLAAGVFRGLPIELAVRDGTVYVAAVTNGDHNDYVGTVHAIAPDGRVTALATEQSGPRNLVIDADFVYWANQGWTDETRTWHDVAIMKVPRSGGPPVMLKEQPEPNRAQSPLAMLAHDSRLYFTNFVVASSVHRMPDVGGAIETLAVDDQIAGHGRVAPMSMVMHGDTLYWVDAYGGAIAMSKNGGARTQLLDPPGAQAHGLSVDDQNLYFVAGRRDPPHGWDVVKMPLQGGPTTPLATGLALGGRTTYLQGSDLYYTDVNDAYRVPIAGGTPVKVLSPGASMIAFDDAYYYWASFDGTINRMAR